MEKLQVIKHPQFGALSVMIIDGKEMFKAKDCAIMLGYKDTINAIKQHCKGVVKHHLPTKGGIQEVSLIPEGDVWRLIIRSKLPQAEAIEKWIMDEVLPSIRKTGTYTMKPEPKSAKEYEYFDKTYGGVPVLTTEDIGQITGINRTTIAWYIRNKTEIGKDYYRLTGIELSKFKSENPKLTKMLKCIYAITRSGFMKLCRAYGIKVEEPKCFEDKSTHNKNDNQDFSIHRMVEKLRREYGYDISVRTLTQEIADDYTDGVIRNQSLTVRQDDKYYIFVDDSAPLPNKRFLAAQGIGCIISGQLRSRRKCLVAEYSRDSLSFASAFMAISMLS